MLLWPVFFLLIQVEVAVIKFSFTRIGLLSIFHELFLDIIYKIYNCYKVYSYKPFPKVTSLEVAHLISIVFPILVKGRFGSLLNF